jgi:SNF2 family DNA or RNA helicase
MTDELYPYQRRAVMDLVHLEGRGGLFLDMGTGKTRTALEIARQLRCRRILVVAPLSAVGVWKRESAVYWSKLKVGDGTVGTIKDRAALALNGGSNLFIVGYETYWREPLRSAIIQWEPQIIIYDEGHRLKGRGTRQSRFAHRLTDIVDRRLTLTGTPMPNGPEDLFGVFRAIEPDLFGVRWLDFEARYLRKGGYLNYQIVGYRNIEEIKAKVKSHSVRVTKQQALDLPEQVDVILPVSLESKTRKVYDELKKRAIAEIQGVVDGQPASGIALSRTVLTNVLRLQTVGSGWVKLASGQIADLSREKESILIDLLSDATQQVGRIVIFCRFRHDIDRLLAALAGRERAFVLDGRTAPKDRDQVLQTFREVEYGYLLAQVAVASLGIDLSCSHTAIFYSLDYSLANYLQSRDRLHRHGQGHKVTYYHLLAEYTIDEEIYAVLQKKENLAKSILDPDRAKELFS